MFVRRVGKGAKVIPLKNVAATAAAGGVTTTATKDVEWVKDSVPADNIMTRNLILDSATVCTKRAILDRLAPENEISRGELFERHNLRKLAFKYCRLRGGGEHVNHYLPTPSVAYSAETGVAGEKLLDKDRNERALTFEQAADRTRNIIVEHCKEGGSTLGKHHGKLVQIFNAAFAFKVDGGKEVRIVIDCLRQGQGGHWWEMTLVKSFTKLAPQKAKRCLQTLALWKYAVEQSTLQWSTEERAAVTAAIGDPSTIKNKGSVVHLHEYATGPVYLKAPGGGETAKGEIAGDSPRKLFTVMHRATEEELLRGLSGSSKGGPSRHQSYADGTLVEGQRSEGKMLVEAATQSFYKVGLLEAKNYHTFGMTLVPTVKKAAGAAHDNDGSLFKLDLASQAAEPKELSVGSYCTDSSCPHYKPGVCLPLLDKHTVANLSGTPLQRRKLWDSGFRSVKTLLPVMEAAAATSSKGKANATSTPAVATTVVAAPTAAPLSSSTSSPSDLQIPDGVTISESNTRYIKAMANNAISLNSKQVENWMEQLQYPLYFIDFEAALFSVPPFAKLKCYEATPFQYSMDVFHENVMTETPTHYEFLHLGADYAPTADPRGLLLNKLIKDLKEATSTHFSRNNGKELALWKEKATKSLKEMEAAQAKNVKKDGKPKKLSIKVQREAEQMMKMPEVKGTFIAHNVTFDSGVLEKLKNQYTEYKDLISGFKWLDTMALFRKGHVTHPNAYSSMSLKKVHPALCPSSTGTSYAKLQQGGGVSHGLAASDTYIRWFHGDPALRTDSSLAKTRQEMLDYCGLDTKGMWEVVRACQHLVDESKSDSSSNDSSGAATSSNPGASVKSTNGAHTTKKKSSKGKVATKQKAEEI